MGVARGVGGVDLRLDPHTLRGDSGGCCPETREQVQPDYIHAGKRQEPYQQSATPVLIITGVHCFWS